MLTLIPSGSRERIDQDQALEITAEWLAFIRKNESPSTLELKIVLTNKSYSPEAAHVIADFVTSTEHFNPCLASLVTSLDLSDIIAGQNTEDGLAVLQTFAQAFVGSSLLEHLDLSDNAMGTRGMPCCEALFTEPRPLKSLSLCNNGLSLEAMQQVADWLVTRNMSMHLEKLHFFNNMSGDEGCMAFQHLLNHCSPVNLSSIRYASTRASIPGSKLIMTGLVNFVQRVTDGGVASMTYLDLTDNKLKGENAHLLAQALHAMPHLEYINLSECDMKNQGLHVIASSLLEHKCITHLDLSGNLITSDGVSPQSPFIQLLKKIGPNLKVLKMQDNTLTSKGVANIVRTMSRGPCALVELTLGNNEFGPNGVTQLIRSADTLLPTLEHLGIHENFLSDNDVEKLVKIFGGILHGHDENIEDSDFEDASLEEEEEEEYEETETDNEQDKKDENQFDNLTQTLSQVHINK